MNWWESLFLLFLPTPPSTPFSSFSLCYSQVLSIPIPHIPLTLSCLFALSRSFPFFYLQALFPLLLYPPSFPSFLSFISVVLPPPSPSSPPFLPPYGQPLLKQSFCRKLNSWADWSGHHGAGCCVLLRFPQTEIVAGGKKLSSMLL